MYWENADHSWSKDSERVINTPSQKSKELFFYLQEVGSFKAFKPYYTEREHLPSYLMKFTRNGSGLLNYQGKEYELHPGDIFLIDCQIYQHYKTISEEPWEMDWIHFNGSNSDKLYQEFIKDGTPIFHTKQQPEENIIHHLIHRLIKNQTYTHARTDFSNSILIHELLNELILQKYELNFNLEEIPLHVTNLKKYLDNHFQQKITLDHLEERFHLNKYQLNKEFSRYIGIPPIEYLITLKISYAKDLLRYSDSTIQSISASIGVDNFAYFSRLFKSRTGMSPSFYRKQG